MMLQPASSARRTLRASLAACALLAAAALGARAGEPAPPGPAAAAGENKPAESAPAPEAKPAPQEPKPAPEAKPAPQTPPSSPAAPSAAPAPAPEAAAVPEEPAEEGKPRIFRFLEFRLSDDWVELRVEKVRGTAPLPGPESADRLHFKGRHTTATVAARAEAEPFFAAWARAGTVRPSLHDVIRPGSDFFTFPPDTKVEENATMDLGGLLGAGAEIRFPVSGRLRAGLSYDLEYGFARTDSTFFLRSAVECEYRYFAHEFLLFADAPVRLDSLFHGWFRPRLELGAFLYRASADIRALDGSIGMDWSWSARRGILVALDLGVESDGGVYAFLRAEFIGRYALCLGAGVRV